MSNVQAHHSAPLRISVDSLIAEHGRWRVALAAMAAAFRSRRNREPHGTRQLCNHLRADIGLPPIVDPPGVHWKMRW